MKNSSIALLRDHGGLIICGFLLYFFSAFGQSVFFGPYLPSIQEELGLSKTALGSIYAIATITSSIIIIFTGKALDIIKLRNFVAITFIGMAIGCFVLAGAQSILALGIAFFILRQFGQGLPVLAASTSINRYLKKNRGKAMAMIALGGSTHIIVFPMMALLLEDHIDWRAAWNIYGIFILLVLMPGFWFYLRNHQKKTHERWQEDLKAEEDNPAQIIRKHWQRTEVLKDWRFYALISMLILSPFIGTAIFFYQRDIAEGLGVTAVAFAAAFPIFTICSVIASFSAGSIIDKFGEKYILATFPIIYTAGLLLLTSKLPFLFAIIGMGCIGGANGMIMATGGPLLAALYGTKHLGSIKSLIFSSAVLGSALSPTLFGFLMDQGIGILTLLACCALYTGIIWVLAFPICKNVVHTQDT